MLLSFLHSSEYFNSRPHKEADGAAAIVSEMMKKFQLTASQGGRLAEELLKDMEGYFNSRPHKEADSNFVTKIFSFKDAFCNYCLYHSYFTLIYLFLQFFFCRICSLFWCESPRKFLCTCLSHYKIAQTYKTRHKLYFQQSVVPVRYIEFQSTC